VATWHNAVLGGGLRRRLLTRLERLAATRADVTLGASSDLVAQARELGAADVRLAPVAAPAMAAPTRSRDAVRAELGVDTDQLIALAVGRLAPQKDYGTLLAAAERLRGDGVFIVIAGDGPLQDELQARIDADGLPVRLLGRRDDVPDLLAAADLYVLTSAWEARALVVQEAMAAGVPVVATAVGGVPELVGDAALLVRAGAADEVAEQMSALAQDADLRRDLAARGREVAAGWPDEDETARQVVAVYREVVGA
jgi:glycosyltransferase involved in cell wall biosynthesis